ncbi:hypothetical protein H4R19_005698, partial [Coemansia spiralis]
PHSTRSTTLSQRVGAAYRWASASWWPWRVRWRGARGWSSWTRQRRRWTLRPTRACSRRSAALGSRGRRWCALRTGCGQLPTTTACWSWTRAGSPSTTRRRACWPAGTVSSAVCARTAASSRSWSAWRAC